MLCDVDIITPGGRHMAGIRNVEVQKACDQLMGWLEQGLSVNLRVAGNDSPLVDVEGAARRRDEDEIISAVVLDIP